MLYNHSANQQHRKVCPQLVFVYSFAGRQLARFIPAVIVTSHLFALLGLRQLHIWHFWKTDPIRPNPTRPIWTDLFVIKWPHFMWGFKVFNKTQVNSLSFAQSTSGSRAHCQIGQTYAVQDYRFGSQTECGRFIVVNELNITLLVCFLDALYVNHQNSSFFVWAEWDILFSPYPTVQGI